MECETPTHEIQRYIKTATFRLNKMNRNQKNSTFKQSN